MHGLFSRSGRLSDNYHAGGTDHQSLITDNYLADSHASKSLFYPCHTNIPCSRPANVLADLPEPSGASTSSASILF